MEWQPIETAPKDGTVIDLFLTPPWANEEYPESYFGTPLGRIKIPGGKRAPGVRFFDAYFCPTHKCWRAKRDLHYVHKPQYEPTHWMPLPEPPQ